MPGWAQLILGVAAVIGALGVIWAKFIKPAANLISDIEDERAFLREIIMQFASAPGSFAVLQEIVKEFRTDSGSSLRDTVNRIERLANESRDVATTVSTDLLAAAGILRARVDTVDHLAAEGRRLDARDRLQLEGLVARVESIDTGMAGIVTQITSLERTLARILAEGDRVATNLSESQVRADVVAADPATDAGAAADVASGSPPDVRPEQ